MFTAYKDLRSNCSNEEFSLFSFKGDLCPFSFSKFSREERTIIFLPIIIFTWLMGKEVTS